MNFDPNFPFFNVPKGGRNIFINSSVTRQVWKNGVLVSSTKNDEDGNPCAPPIIPQIRQPMHKEVKNEFNIEDSSINNFASGNSGPVSFNNKKTLYKSGARDNSVNIKGGTFTKANIGGTSDHRNSDTQMDTGSRDSDEDEDFNLEEAVKVILQKGVTTQQFLQALKGNCKVSLLYQEVQYKTREDVQEFMRALLS